MYYLGSMGAAAGAGVGAAVDDAVAKGPADEERGALMGAAREPPSGALLNCK